MAEFIPYYGKAATAEIENAKFGIWYPLNHLPVPTKETDSIGCMVSIFAPDGPDAWTEPAFWERDDSGNWKLRICPDPRGGRSAEMLSKMATSWMPYPRIPVIPIEEPITA